ncbi:hypothetical protein PMAYCL1PPCAC_15358, partial [Pristionchus mayeri]
AVQCKLLLTHGKWIMGHGCSHPDSRVVETTYGQVQGRRLVRKGEKQVDAFKGIPYAKPPVGELRFEKPQIPEKWSGIKETKGFAKRSVQSSAMCIDDLVLGSTSEDCLYLNVFTPCWDPPKEGFPVMVFIHGGGFEMGDTAIYGDVNICEHIVARDVVFVTVAYRLGYLGFFTTGDDVCPGNFGLWDQTAALRWVNENIEAFGGNKNNITLLGQSAGGISTDLLDLSPHSTGLFHKKIVMSGTADIIILDCDMPQHCRDKAARLGITDYKNSKELIDKLRTIPAEKFIYDTNEYKKEKEKEESRRFETVPYLEGDFFPAPLDELRKKAIPKPMMAGITKEESIGFIFDKKLNEEYLNQIISLAARRASDIERAEIRFKPFSIDNLLFFQVELRALYESEEFFSNKQGMMRAIMHIVSDCYMNADTLELCRKTIANQDSPVYLYVFDRYNPILYRLNFFKGLYEGCGIRNYFQFPKVATHAGELFYFFDKGLFSKHPKFSRDDGVVMEAFTTAFTNFAKFGNPNGANPSMSDLPSQWIPVDNTNCGRHFVFEAEHSHMEEEYFEGRPAKYIEILGKAEKEEEKPSLDLSTL